MVIEQEFYDIQLWIYIVITIALVILVGSMSFLMLGLMSLSLMDLEVLSKSGTPQDRTHAGVYYCFFIE